MAQRWNVAKPRRWQVIDEILPHRAYILVLQLDFFQLTEGHMRCRKVLLWGFWALILNETGPILNMTAVGELLSPGQVTMFDGARLRTQQSSQVTNTQRKGVTGASFKFWNHRVLSLDDIWPFTFLCTMEWAWGGKWTDRTGQQDLKGL